MWTQLRLVTRSRKLTSNRRPYAPFVPNVNKWVGVSARSVVKGQPSLQLQIAHFATKNNSQKLKESTRKDAEKEKERIRKEKEKEKERARKEKEKEKLKKEKEREKARKAKAKEEEKKIKLKEKEKARKEKEKALAEEQKRKKELAKEQEMLKPKRVRTSFAYYVAENYAREAKKHPDEKAPAIAKRLSANWASLSDDAKKPYIEKAEKDKKRRDEEMKEYEKSLPPKRPLSSFLLFSQEKRKELQKSNPNLSVTEIGKLLGNKWKEASEAEKQSYRNRAEEAKKEYQAKLAQK